MARQPRALRPSVVVSGMVLVLLVWWLREPIRERLVQWAVMSNRAPSAGAVSRMIQNASDPRQALFTAWEGGGVVHRQVAIRHLPRLFPVDDVLPPEAEATLVSAAYDADVSVREVALSVLAERDHALLPSIAVGQLEDVDPEVRLLGLRYLKLAPSRVGVPLGVELFDDPDLRVVNHALRLIERWSGEDFGVALSDTVKVVDPVSGLAVYQEAGVANVRAALVQARGWWQLHEADFPPVDLASVPVGQKPRLVSPGDFALRDLEGQTVRLSDFRGRTVLINFWTTWCTACVAEIPALIALQEKHIDELVVLGVSLDFVPDSHGHLGGHAAVEDQGHSDGHHDDEESARAARTRVRRKVERIADLRGVNYPILLDEHNEVGGLFNGGELPTTVIIDGQGVMRRRFIGARAVEVFEAMVQRLGDEGINP